MRSILSRRVVVTALFVIAVLGRAAAAQEIRPAVDLRQVPAMEFDNWPADFNRDGITDLVGTRLTGGQWIVQVVLGNGDGTFQLPLVSTHAGRPLSTAPAMRRSRSCRSSPRDTAHRA